MKKLTFLLFLFIGGCSTAPDFDRENENDPTSSNFIPDISDFSVSINSDKTVSLSWSDDSNFEQGFIVSKSFGSDSNFVALDTLQINSEFYRDTSKKLDLNTFYKISAFSSNSKQEDLNGVTLRLNFGSLSDFESTTVGNQINLNWDSSDLYADNFLIEKKQPDSEEWEIVETVERNLNSYSFIDLHESYFVDIRVSAVLESFDSKLVPLSSSKKVSIPYNLPSDFELSIINESEALFSWKDQSDFDDDFIIYQRTSVTNCCNQPFSELTSLDTLTLSSQTGKLISHNNSVSLFQFYIAPYNSGLGNVGSLSEPIEYVLHMRPPNTFRLEVNENNTATISWQDGNIPSENDPVHSYYFEWSTDNINFNSSGSLPKTLKEYTITNLDISKVYYFRVRTYNSNYSFSAMSFQNIFKENRSIGLNLGPYRENDALTITNDFIFQGSKIIDLQDYSVAGLSHTNNNDLVGGSSIGDNTIYYSNDTKIRIDMYDRNSLSYIGSYSDPEMMDYFSVNYLKSSNEVLFSFSRFGEDGNATLVLQRWNENFSELKEEVELRNKTSTPCTTISYLVISDNEENALLLCNGFANEGTGANRGQVLEINPHNFSDLKQILDAETVRDFLFEEGSTSIIYFLSRKDIVKYDINNNIELNRTSTLEYGGLYDLSFSNDGSKIYSIGTQISLSGASSTFFALNKDDFSIIEKIEVPGKYYFVRSLGDGLFYFIGEGSKIMEKTSNWKLK